MIFGEMNSETTVRLLKKVDYEAVSSWSPDLSRLVVSGVAPGKGWRSGFYLVSRDGKQCKHLANHLDADGIIRLATPSWSPDGQHFAVSTLLSNESRDFSLLIFDFAGKLLYSLCWPNEHFERIDDIVWNYQAQKC